MSLDWMIGVKAKARRLLASRPLRVSRPFLASRAGAIAPMFGLIAVPVVVAMGAAVDIGRSIDSRNNLQDALDATSLAISHLPSSTPAATVQADAQQWLNANLHDGNIGNVTLTVTTSTQWG
jgi:Flp pilus assembly protein TadG